MPRTKIPGITAAPGGVSTSPGLSPGPLGYNDLADPNALVCRAPDTVSRLGYNPMFAKYLRLPHFRDLLDSSAALLGSPQSRPLEFRGPALKLTEDDVKQAAKSVGCDVAAIKTVMEVEVGAKRHGFLADGRPIILFEAHVFSRFTEHQYDKSVPDISSRKRNAKLYKGGKAEYERLSRAIDLNRAAALKSASWGLCQIMGFNYKLAGFGDVEAFVKAQTLSEGEHLKAFVAFVKGKKLDASLKSLDWAAFAEGYNGAAYADNQYDTRLAAAYAKHVKAEATTPAGPR